MNLEETLEEPSQKTIRRGGVSAEPITEEEIKTYKKKIVPKGLYILSPDLSELSATKLLRYDLVVHLMELDVLLLRSRNNGCLEEIHRKQCSFQSSG